MIAHVIKPVYGVKAPTKYGEWSLSLLLPLLHKILPVLHVCKSLVSIYSYRNEREITKAVIWGNNVYTSTQSSTHSWWEIRYTNKYLYHK